MLHLTLLRDPPIKRPDDMELLALRSCSKNGARCYTRLYYDRWCLGVPKRDMLPYNPLAEVHEVRSSKVLVTGAWVWVDGEPRRIYPVYVYDARVDEDTGTLVIRSKLYYILPNNCVYTIASNEARVNLSEVAGLKSVDIVIERRRYSFGETSVEGYVAVVNMQPGNFRNASRALLGNTTSSDKIHVDAIAALKVYELFTILSRLGSGFKVTLRGSQRLRSMIRALIKSYPSFSLSPSPMPMSITDTVSM